MKVTVPPQKVIKEITTTEDQDKRSYWEMLITGIVRPPRANYRDTQLGTRQFTYNQILYTRLQEKVSHEGKNIELTMLRPENANNWIILYLHGNSSSKLEAVSLLKFLPRSFSLGCFDFIGCGKNQEEDNITLGARESKQVGTLVDYLEKKGYRVALWGRSMGAASALKYGKAEIIVADSSFKCLKSLFKQVAKKHSPGFVPNCMINCLFPCVYFKIKQDVKKKAEYDIEELDIREAVKNIDESSMVVFMSGQQDTLIHHRNSQKLFKAFKGQQKYLQTFEGTHNTKRPDAIIRKVMGYIQKYAEKHKQLVPKSPPRTSHDSGEGR